MNTQRYTPSDQECINLSAPQSIQLVKGAIFSYLPNWVIWRNITKEISQRKTCAILLPSKFFCGQFDSFMLPYISCPVTD